MQPLSKGLRLLISSFFEGSWEILDKLNFWNGCLGISFALAWRFRQGWDYGVWQ